MSFAPGARIGPYEVVALLGAGGMGEVYRAHDTRLMRPVAIKVWRHEQKDVATQARRMLREARAASALNHPNIVIVYELGETPEGDPFIVQEFIEGRTLREHLDHPLALERIVALGTQICRALAAAHAASIVHRDIKPDNVMVRADGYVKVLDFGIARSLDVAQADDTTHTAAQTMQISLAGTPMYMSPEQMADGEVTPAADLFALGVVFYEMATAQRPFSGTNTITLATSIATDTPVPISRLVPDLPREFCDLVDALLDKSPDRRPTASETEAALTALLVPGGSSIRRSVASATTVGRAAELDLLRAAYARVRDGSGVLIGLAGEPGIGKTSLLNAFLDDLTASGDRPMVARSRCSETLAGTEAYLPVLEALDSLRASFDGKSINKLMMAVAPTWHQQLGAVTMTAPTDAKESIPATSRERMKREMDALLHDLSRRTPLIWVIDDLHWADVSTVDMLNYLAGHFDRLRVLIVACLRPSDMALSKHPFLAIRTDLQSRGHYEEISLGFLTREDVARYLALQFPGHRFPPSLVESVHTRTEGSPLFMADLVRYLRDTGSVVQVDGRWEVARELPDTPRELPESVRGMIARKIERVDEQSRRLLLGASVQGQEFDSTVLGEALDMDPADVEEQLEALEQVHVFVQRGEEHEYPDRTLTLRYRFVHVLYQNVLYASLQPTRRASLSAKTAQALVAHHGSDVSGVAGRLAVLFEAARDFRSAGQYFAIAAMRSVGLFGFREALTLADRGLKGVRSLPAEPATHQLELQLQMIRGLATRWVMGWSTPELESTFARARYLCQQLDDPPEVFPVLWNLAFFNMIRGQLSAVQEQLPTLVTLAEASKADKHLVSVNHVGGVTSEALGDVRESTRQLEEARRLHDPARHLAYTAEFGIDPGMVARAMSSRPLWALGYPDRALTRCLETLALCRSQRQPVTLVFGLVVAAGIRVYRGEAEEALVVTDEIFTLCKEYEFPQEAEWGRAFQGAASSQLGRLEEGRQQLDQSLSTLTVLRSGIVRTMFLSLQAEACWRAGHMPEGLVIIDEALAYAESSLERGFLHELHRLKGQLLLLAHQPVEAERNLRVALEHAQRWDARGFELRAATSLARLLHDTGRTAQGRAVLLPVFEWFTEGLQTADLRAARTLVSQMN